MALSDFTGIVLLIILFIGYYIAEKMIDGKDGIGEVKKVISDIGEAIDRFVKWVNKY